MLYVCCPFNLHSDSTFSANSLAYPFVKTPGSPAVVRFHMSIATPRNALHLGSISFVAEQSTPKVSGLKNKYFIHLQYFGQLYEQDSADGFSARLALGHSGSRSYLGAQLADGPRWPHSFFWSWCWLMAEINVSHRRPWASPRGTGIPRAKPQCLSTF